MIVSSNVEHTSPFKGMKTVRIVVYAVTECIAAVATRSTSRTIVFRCVLSRMSIILHRLIIFVNALMDLQKKLPKAQRANFCNNNTIDRCHQEQSRFYFRVVGVVYLLHNGTLHGTGLRIHSDIREALICHNEQMTLLIYNRKT